MCKSQKDGGQRCAAHTRPKFEAALANFTMSRTIGRTVELREAAEQYASTAEGHEAVLAAAEQAWAQRDRELGGVLTRAAADGATLREKNIAAAQAIRAAQGVEETPLTTETQPGYLMRRNNHDDVFDGIREFQAACGKETRYPQGGDRPDVVYGYDPKAAAEAVRKIAYGVYNKHASSLSDPFTSSTSNEEVYGKELMAEARKLEGLTMIHSSDKTDQYPSRDIANFVHKVQKAQEQHAELQRDMVRRRKASAEYVVRGETHREKLLNAPNPFDNLDEWGAVNWGTSPALEPASAPDPFASLTADWGVSAPAAPPAKKSLMSRLLRR